MRLLFVLLLLLPATASAQDLKGSFEAARLAKIQALQADLAAMKERLASLESKYGALEGKVNKIDENTQKILQTVQKQPTFDTTAIESKIERLADTVSENNQALTDKISDIEQLKLSQAVANTIPVSTVSSSPTVSYSQPVSYSYPVSSPVSYVRYASAPMHHSTSSFTRPGLFGSTVTRSGGLFQGGGLFRGGGFSSGMSGGSMGGG